MKRNSLLTVLPGFACIMLRVISYARERTISGTVLEEKAVTLAGATITVKGKNNATRSDVNGKFSISVPVSARIAGIIL